MKLNADLKKCATCNSHQQHWKTSPSAGSWLRLPPDSMQNIQAKENCLVLQKTGHLKQPITYV